MKKRSPRYKEWAGVFQPRLPADQRSQQTAANAAVGLINQSPLIESTVIANFDARPINAHDFYASGGTFVYAPIEVGGAAGAFFNYTVGEGYRAILRGYRYTISPIVIPVNGFITNTITGKLYLGDPTTLDLQPNAIAVPDYNNLQHGQSVTTYQPCYVLAESGSTISLVLIFSGTYAAAMGDAGNSIQIEFYGNILLNTGRPLTFEPGLSTPVPVKDISGH